MTEHKENIESIENTERMYYSLEARMEPVKLTLAIASLDIEEKEVGIDGAIKLASEMIEARCTSLGKLIEWKREAEARRAEARRNAKARKL